MSNWRDKVKQAMREQDVTQDVIAARLGITRGAVGHKLAGRRDTSLPELQTMSEILTLNFDKLVSEMLQEANEDGAPREGRPAYDLHLVNEDGKHVFVGSPAAVGEMVYVPAVLGAHLSAGAGEVIYDADEEVNAVAFRLDWMQMKGLRPERCKVWRVRGDSMEPRYSNGDSLLIDMGDRTPRHGKNFALVGDDGLRVKQLRAMAGGGWEMYSLNPDKSRYPTEPIVKDNYAVIGRVRGRSGDED